jgi:hypothetical protein
MPARSLQNESEQVSVDYIRELNVVRAFVRRDESWIGARIALDARIELLEEITRDVACLGCARLVGRVIAGLSEVRSALDGLLDSAPVRSPYAQELARYVGAVYVWGDELGAATVEMVDSVGWERRSQNAAAASRACFLGELEPAMRELRSACGASGIARLVARLHTEVFCLNRDLAGVR